MRTTLLTSLICFSLAVTLYPQNPSHPIKTISVDCNDIDKEVELLSTFRVDFIPLETNKDCLIRRIEKVDSTGDHFLVWDKSQKTVFVFRKDCSYVNKITAVSHPGPGEFTYCYDIDATGNQIYLLSYQTILVYDMNFKVPQNHKNRESLRKIPDQ